MSQDDKPIFPRFPENSEEENRKLRNQARLNLENAEKNFDSSFSQRHPEKRCLECGADNPAAAPFCLTCGLSLPTPSSQPYLMITPTVYGPPPLPMNDISNPPPYSPAPAYGPPPIFVAIKWGIIVGGVVLLTAALILILLAVYFFIFRAGV